MIKAEDGRVIFEGKRDKVLAEVASVYVYLKSPFQRKSTKW